MIRRLVVLFVLSLGIVQAVAAAELSEDELRMKERLVALSQGTDSLEDLRIELADGNMVASRTYDIAGGKIVSRIWDAPGSPEKREERSVTDEEVRRLLRELVDKQYWTFQGTQFTPDNTMFLFRFYYKDLQPVDYRCDVEEYKSSPQRSAVRSVLLNFVQGSSPAAQPVTHEGF